ncbi:MAG: rhodanese-like domain-containing protein [Candidatus Moraniibacteriota bacterium]
MYAEISHQEFKNLIKEDVEDLEIIDVREEDEYRRIRVEGSKLIPMGEVLNNLDKIDWDKKVVLICRSGSRSGYVANVLDKMGKKVTNLAGGIFSLELDNCDCLEK